MQGYLIKNFAFDCRSIASTFLINFISSQNQTNTRCFIYNDAGLPVFKATKKLEILVPEPGAAEMDPEKIWVAVREVVREVVTWAKDKNYDVRGLGISMQRNTGTFWCKNSFKLLSPFITWQDVRCKKVVDQINGSLRFEIKNGMEHSELNFIKLTFL